MELKIDIVSGFLGAGKTTLIKKLLAEELHKEKVALIENEFGEIGIDGETLKETVLEIKEITSGCICCSLQGSLREALEELTKNFKPERVVIEPSGLGKLSEVISAVQDFVHRSGKGALNMKIVVVDSLNYQAYLDNFGDFYKDQIAAAGTVILSRTQLADKGFLDLIIDNIRKLNTGAKIIATPWEQLSGRQIIELSEKRDKKGWESLWEKASLPLCSHNAQEEQAGCLRCLHAYEHGERDLLKATFQSWGRETTMFYEEDLLHSILDELGNSPRYGQIIRAKGVLQGEDGHWINFDYVPGEKNIRRAAPAATGKLCVIGQRLNTAALHELFFPKSP